MERTGMEQWRGNIPICDQQEEGGKVLEEKRGGTGEQNIFLS